jgi:hypothetical protein
MNPKAIFATVIALAITIASAGTALAGDMKVTTISDTNSMRFTAAQVARGGWVDCRSVLPAAATVSVSRIYSTGTDTVATVVCSGGIGRGALNSTNWFFLYGEYLRYSGATAGVVRVISLPN